MVPTGAGEARQLTHDNISYEGVRYLPDGKQLLASGIEAGHGARDYLIDVSSGDSKPITPEGIAGTALSPDGRNLAVHGAGWEMGRLAAGRKRPAPGSGAGLEVGMCRGGRRMGRRCMRAQGHSREKAADLYRVNVATGKTELWRTFGENLPAGASRAFRPTFSSDGSAYAYVYYQALSEAYVVKGLE